MEQNIDFLSRSESQEFSKNAQRGARLLETCLCGIFVDVFEMKDYGINHTLTVWGSRWRGKENESE